MSLDDPRVAELRSLVQSDLTPYYDTHFNLLRWIQAFPELSMPKIARRLRHHLLFRTSPWNVDKVHEKEQGCHPMHKYWPNGKCGMSGVIPRCIVCVEQAGYMDYDGMLSTFSITEAVKALLYYGEDLLAHIMQIEKETGEQASVVYVYDATNVVYSKQLVDLILGPLMALAECLFIHYVELIKHAVFVNVPSFAPLLWTMVKPILPGRTKEKIVLLSSNWRDEIQSFMQPSICPSFWNDATHKDFQLAMDRPQRVPLADLIAKTPPQNLEELNIKAGKVHWMELNLEKGDCLSFTITTTTSFGFGILLVDKEEDEDVVAMRQLFPDFPGVPGPLRVPIEETVIVPETGLYKVWISNSRAWLRSLTFKYKFEIVKAKTNSSAI